MSQGVPYDALPSKGGFPQATPAPAPEPTLPVAPQQQDTERAEEARREPTTRVGCLGLHLISWLGNVGVVLLTAMLMLVHKGGLLTPLILAPSMAFFLWCFCKKKGIEDFDLLVRKYHSGLFVGTLTIVIVQAICLYSLAFLFFVVHKYPSGILVHSFIICVIFTYVFVEEAFKFVVAQGRSTRADAIYRQRAAEAEAGVGNSSDLTDPMPDSRLYLLYSLASAAGLATGSMFFWWTVLLLSGVEENDPDLFKVGLIYLGAIVVLVFTYHMLTAYLIGLRLARRREERRAAGSGKAGKRWYSILWFPVLARCVSLLLFVHGNSALDRDGGWLLSFSSIFALIYVIKREERKMPATYLRQVGYMTAFGYGALPTSDEEAGQSLGGLDLDGPDFWLDAEETSGL